MSNPEGINQYTGHMASMRGFGNAKKWGASQLKRMHSQHEGYTAHVHSYFAGAGKPAL